jgi:hypothetical protein
MKTLFESLNEKTEKHNLRWHQARILLNWVELELLGEHLADAEQTRLRLAQARQLFSSLPAPGFVRKIDRLSMKHTVALNQTKTPA